jgi:hypothetical protein
MDSSRELPSADLEIGKAREVVWVISSHERNVDSTEKDFKKWLKAHASDHLSDVDIDVLVVGFKDILTNAVNYGNLGWKPPEGDPNLTQDERAALIREHARKNPELGNKQVRIVITLEKDRLKVVILDKGQGFKIENVPDPLAPDRIMRNTGRGIFMAKNTVFDSVEYNQTQEGLEVVLTKEF